MKEVKITIKGTLVTLEYCSQKVMKELVKAGEYSNQTSAFEGEFYNGFYWTEVNELFVDGEETKNLIQNVGPIARTIEYFHNLFSDSHPLPVELHSKSQNGELDYIVEIEDNEEFEIKELQLIYSNELANTDVNQFGFPRYPQAILGSKILYKGKEVPVLEDDDFDDKIAINSRDYKKEIINGWRPCFAIINGEANIPEGTEKIDRNAFRDCSDLTSIVIPNTVTFIWDCAFSGCPNLSSIVVSEGNKIYDSRDNCNAIIKTESNTLITGCKNTVIPDSVTEIGSYAFDGCTGLTSIVISDSVTVIGSEAFSGCPGRTNIVVSEGNKVLDSRDNCNAIIHTKSNTLEVGCKNTVIPDTVTGIGSYAFKGCTGLTSIVIPDLVTEIGRYAFFGCTGLTSIVIPDSVTRIGSSAFEGCTGLTSIVIPSSVELEGGLRNSCIFRGCTGLKSVEIQAKLKSIDYAMFANCISLETVTFPASISKIDEAAFKGCTALKTINVPAKKADYYKKRLPWNLHRLIVELPVEKKAKKK